MPDINRFIDETLDNSITDDVLALTPVDKTTPLSFIDWLKYNGTLALSTDELFKRYNNYLNNWFQAKSYTPEATSDTVTNLYKNFINEIVLNYTSIDERRFLKNIDQNNPRDLAIAVPFFAKKVKDICIYFSTLRDKLKYNAVEYNLKGSIYGVEKIIYNEISKNLETQDLTELISTLNLTASGVRNNIIVELEELYDNYSNYFDLGTLPASSYEATGMRNTDFILNILDIDENYYLNFDKSVVNAITSYPFFLTELGTNNFTIVPTVNASQLNLLKDRDFINNINNNANNNLKLNLLSQVSRKYMGTDFYYVSTGSTLNSVTSGVLFQADSPFANYLNKTHPTIAFVPEDSQLKTPKAQGLFFKPDKLGLLNFFNFNFTSTVNVSSLTPNTVYIFPDPKKFGNISGNTQQDQDTPLTFIEDNSFTQIDYNNGYKFGDVKSDPLLHTFKGYQSREQSINFSNQGLSRHIDPQDFFRDFEKNIWANEDVYPLQPVNAFPIDERLEKLLSLNKTLVQYKSDVYGNDYGLYKIIGDFKNTSGILSAYSSSGDILTDRNCLILDGHVFYDPVSGFNFDYTEVNPAKGYSGVIFRTTNSIPPGSGYFVYSGSLTATSPLSASQYNNGVPEYALSGSPYVVASYRFQPERFCSGTVDTTIICNVKEGFSFVAPNGTLLVDPSTDDPTFEPLVTPTYFDELAEAGANPAAPGYRPTFAYAASFTFEPPASALTPFLGYYFVVSSFTDQFTPCNDEFEQDPDLTLPARFFNIRLPNRETEYVPTLTGSDGRKSIYDTRYTTYGDFYIRNSNTSLIEPVSSALSAIFIKYPAELRDEINNAVVNFDVYYDTLQVETENHLIFDKIEFNYAKNNVRTSSNNETYVTRGINKEFEKFTTVWFDERNNELIFAKTTLHPTASASNFKSIYPVIYSLNLNTFNLIQIYPYKRVENVDYLDVIQFSLTGTNQNIDINTIDKPLLTLNSETNTYSITYMAKDTTNMFYIFVTDFKYFNGTLTNVVNSMYRPNIDTIHNNFSNPTNQLQYGAFAVLGSVAANTGGELNF